MLWDTEHNNGVLIYLQLAEHAIEIVADRGVNRYVSSQDWQTMAQRMGLDDAVFFERKDRADVCYKYIAKPVPCPADKTKIKQLDLQHEQNTVNPVLRYINSKIDLLWPDKLKAPIQPLQE